MSELTLSNNDFEGNLYDMPQNLFFVETANNPKLCGMVRDISDCYWTDVLYRPLGQYQE